MVRMLPIIRLGKSKRYFVDARLNQLRNIHNPHDTESMGGSEEFYIRHFGYSALDTLRKS